MKFRNLLIGAVAFLAIAVITPTANAQLGLPQLVLSSDNVTGKNMTNTTALTNVVDCTRGKELAIQLTSAASAATTSNIVMYLETSLDQSNWNTEKTYTLALNGTTTVNLVTNQTVSAVPFVRLRVPAIAQTNVVATNFNVRVFVK